MDTTGSGVLFFLHKNGMEKSSLLFFFHSKHSPTPGVREGFLGLPLRLVPCCGFKAHAPALFGHFFISRDHPSECKYSPSLFFSPLRLASRFYKLLQWHLPLFHPFHDILSFPTSYLPSFRVEKRNFAEETWEKWRYKSSHGGNLIRFSFMGMSRENEEKDSVSKLSVHSEFYLFYFFILVVSCNVALYGRVWQPRSRVTEIESPEIWDDTRAERAMRPQIRQREMWEEES